MRKAATADERERRMIEYLLTCHQGRLAEFKLSRLNRIANSRKKLMELLDEIIEARAEDLAAGMLMEYAPPRPARREIDLQGMLPLPPRKIEKQLLLGTGSGVRRRSTG